MPWQCGGRRPHRWSRRAMSVRRARPARRQTPQPPRPWPADSSPPAQCGLTPSRATRAPRGCECRRSCKVQSPPAPATRRSVVPLANRKSPSNPAPPPAQKSAPCPLVRRASLQDLAPRCARPVPSARRAARRASDSGREHRPQGWSRGRALPRTEKTPPTKDRREPLHRWRAAPADRLSRPSPQPASE